MKEYDSPDWPYLERFLQDPLMMFTGNGRFLLFFLIALPSAAFAQQELYGKVVKRGGTEILPGVTVFNVSRDKYNQTDMGGNFKITATAGDTLLFSSVGYRPDTIIVVPYMFDENYIVPLTPNVVTLARVEVDEMTNYEQDSLKRRESYGFILDRPHTKLVNKKKPGDAPGFSFSPIGRFSAAERHKRDFEKKLEEQEKDYYIDYKFSPGRVAQLTRLKGDSLHEFMLRYRPSYDFCRNATSKDILLYINEKLTEYKKSKGIPAN